MSIYRKPFTVAGSEPFSGSDWTGFNRLAKQNVLAVVQQLLPGGKVIGKEYVVRNPTRVDRRAGSFKICISGPNAGFWSDFATSAKGRGNDFLGRRRGRRQNGLDAVGGAHGRNLAGRR